MQAATRIPTPTVLHSEYDFAVGKHGPVFIVAWRHETTVEGMKRVASLFSSCRFLPQSAGLFTIIDPDAPLPNNEARDAGAQFMRASSAEIAVSAVVFEGAGFRNAAVRAVVTGLTLLARQPFPHRVFSNTGQAARWFVEAGPSDWRVSPSVLHNAIQLIRRP
jgi:hypothetical protein